jgi:hypothetical protein
MFGGILPGRRSVAGAIFASAALAAALGIPGAATGRSAAAFDRAQLAVVTDSFGGFTSVSASLDVGALDNPANGIAARVDLTVPPGYTFDLSDKPGSSAGFLLAIAASAGGGSDTSLLAAPVVVEDPAAYAADPIAQACAPGPHTAVWLAAPQILGRALELPIAVDATPTGDGRSSYTLHFCPLETPSAAYPSGVTLVSTELDFATATAPKAAGTYQWSALVTPATPGPLTPDPGTAFELRARVPVPNVLTLHARYDAKAKTAVLTGQLVQAGVPRANATVAIQASGELGPGTSLQTTTNAAGMYSARVRIRQTTLFNAVVAGSVGACVEASTAPGGCRNESGPGASSRLALLALPRATDPKVSTNPRDQALARRSVLMATDIPGSLLEGDAPPPCAAFAPNLHRLTATGNRSSPAYLTADRKADMSATASVFATVADARTDFAGIAQLAAARCEGRLFAESASADAKVAKLGKLAVPRIGSDSRAYRATITSQEFQAINVDIVFVRVSRVVIALHVHSLGSVIELERFIARVLVARAGQD